MSRERKDFPPESSGSVPRSRETRAESIRGGGGGGGGRRETGIGRTRVVEEERRKTRRRSRGGRLWGIADSVGETPGSSMLSTSTTNTDSRPLWGFPGVSRPANTFHALLDHSARPTFSSKEHRDSQDKWICDNSPRFDISLLRLRLCLLFFVARSYVFQDVCSNEITGGEFKGRSWRLINETRIKIDKNWLGKMLY